MSSPSKKKGSHFEAVVAQYLQEQGWPNAERRLAGDTHDRGDIAGIPGVVIEAKNANRMELSQWVAERDLERDNDGAHVGVLVAKRPRKASPADAYWILNGEDLCWLLRQAGF